MDGIPKGRRAREKAGGVRWHWTELLGEVWRRSSLKGVSNRLQMLSEELTEGVNWRGRDER